MPPANAYAAYLANRPPPPEYDWTIERHPTEDLAAGWSRVSGLRGNVLAMEAEVAAWGPFVAPGDLLRAMRGGYGTQWYVPEGGRPVRLPSQPGGDSRRTDKATEGRPCDWPAWWALPDGEVLLDMAVGMVIPKALEGAIVDALVPGAVASLLSTVPTARRARLVEAARVLAAGRPGDRTAFGLEVLDACQDLGGEDTPEPWLWGAISSRAVTINHPCVCAATLVRAFEVGRSPEEARALAADERSRQADLVRARLPLRAVMECYADAAVG